MKVRAEYLESIKSRVQLSQIIAVDVALRRAGSEWAACCPFHAEKSASFFVNDKKQFFHCFGCGAHGDAIGWYMRKRGFSFDLAVETLAGEKPPSDAMAFENNLRRRAEEHAERPVLFNDGQMSRMARARAMWQHRAAFSKTKAETYLRSRGIRLGKWPPTLGFVDQAWHGWERVQFPALLGALQDGEGRVTAIQTIFLREDGMAKAGVKPAKPVTGPMGDGAVRLAKPGKILGIAEGIETALSARQLYSLPVWASLGASRLGAIKLPEVVDTVIIFADNGERGKAEAEKAAHAYGHQGYAFQIEYPPEGFDDFNDVLQQKSVAA